MLRYRKNGATCRYSLHPCSRKSLCIHYFVCARPGKELHTLLHRSNYAKLQTKSKRDAVKINKPFSPEIQKQNIVCAPFSSLLFCVLNYTANFPISTRIYLSGFCILSDCLFLYLCEIDLILFPLMCGP